jgi:hypothetical protein
MVPDNAWPLVVAYSLAYLLIGFVVGASTGYLTALLARNRPATLLTDGLFGSVGFWAGFLVTALIPWPYNTVIRHLNGGGTVATSTNSYQHPERVAVILAILLPLFNELSRLRKKKSTKLA